MADNAGFAGAMAIRAQVLGDALLSSYAAGSFPSSIPLTVDGPPEVDLSQAFLGVPQIACLEGLLRLTLPAWGPLPVDGVSPVRVVAGSIDIDIVPQFVVHYDAMVKPTINELDLDPLSTQLSVSRLELAVVDGDPFPDAVQTYLSGTDFVDAVQSQLRTAVLFGVVKLPPIDISFFGDLPAAVEHDAQSRVEPGALLVGLNLSQDDVSQDHVVLTGDINQMQDFTGDHDIVAITNPDALTFSQPSVLAEIQKHVDAAGAKLTGFTVTAETGQLRFRAQAQESGVTLSMSFAVVPVMFHTQPAYLLQTIEPQIVVHAKTWPALEFQVQDVSIDTSMAWWEDLLEVLAVLVFGVTGASAVLYVEEFISGLADTYGAEIADEPNRSAGARVQRRAVGSTGAVLRVELADYTISPDEGTTVGIRLALKQPPAALVGPLTIPADYAGQALVHRVSMPVSARDDDPRLRIRWSVSDTQTGAVLASDDGLAAGRHTYTWTPSTTAPGRSVLTIRAEVYRDLGPQTAALADESLTMTIRGPLPRPAYVRWTYGVGARQLQFSDADQAWKYNGTVSYIRRSAIHRTDQPCRFATPTSLYSDGVENLTLLPFPLHLLEGHRADLCDYCFYGGPTGLLAAL